jgi:hypothetical protein
MAAAPATTAPAMVGSTTVDGGSMSMTYYRDRWGVHFSVRIKDTKADGHCVYAEVKVIVSQGNDPDKRVATVCGNGTSKSVSTRLAASLGRAITGAEVKVCREARFVDPCKKVVGTVPQYTTRATASRLKEMNGIEALSLTAFLKKKAAAPGVYDWSDDGCSTPGIKAAWAPWRSRFAKACARHDWGYYNFGQAKQTSKTTWFQATDTRRKAIDDRFLSDLKGLCAAHPSWGDGCYGWATAFYQGVRQGGGSGFYS